MQEYPFCNVLLAHHISEHYDDSNGDEMNGEISVYQEFPPENVTPEIIDNLIWATEMMRTHALFHYLVRYLFRFISNPYVNTKILGCISTILAHHYSRNEFLSEVDRLDTTSIPLLPNVQQLADLKFYDAEADYKDLRSNLALTPAEELDEYEKKMLDNRFKKEVIKSIQENNLRSQIKAKKILKKWEIAGHPSL